MDKDDTMPVSENLRREETDDFLLTLGSWKTYYGKSFEIGIRRKDNGAFELMQGWDTKASCNYGFEMIKVLLEAGYTTQHIQDHLRSTY